MGIRNITSFSAAGQRFIKNTSAGGCQSLGRGTGREGLANPSKNANR
jgi:hypothetical protein